VLCDPGVCFESGFNPAHFFFFFCFLFCARKGGRCVRIFALVSPQVCDFWGGCIFVCLFLYDIPGRFVLSASKVTGRFVFFLCFFFFFCAPVLFRVVTPLGVCGQVQLEVCLGEDWRIPGLLPTRLVLLCVPHNSAFRSDPFIPLQAPLTRHLLPTIDALLLILAVPFFWHTSTCMSPSGALYYAFASRTQTDTFPPVPFFVSTPFQLQTPHRLFSPLKAGYSWPEITV